MEITKEKVNQAVSLGTLNPRMLNQFFHDIKLKSYAYDYLFQRELADVEVRKIPTSNGRSCMLKKTFNDTFSRVIEFTIPIRFGVDSHREMYKRSDVFDTYMDFATMQLNRKYFRFLILPSLNGKILLNYRVKAMHERVNICFLRDDVDPTEAGNVVFYFIPNSFMTVIENPYAGLFDQGMIDSSVFYPNLPYHTIKPYIGYWIDKETNKGYMIPKITYDVATKKFNLHSQLPTDVSKYSLCVIGIMHLCEITDFPAGTEWIQFEERKCPLPKDNILIMVQKDDMYQLNDSDVWISEYYPNIYKVHNPKNYPLRFMEIYEENTENDHIVYDNEAARYMREFNLLDQYKLNEVPTILKNFRPVDWLYGIDDFLEKNPYTSLDLTDKWPSFLYKLQNISNMLKKWCMLYLEYTYRTYGFLTGWYHKISEYDDMEEKRRMNTGPDTNNDPLYYHEFKEEQYVFSYVHNVMTGDVNSFCFFIDGKYTLPTKIVVYQNIQYVYFPKRIINEDTVIEVERFDGNMFMHRVDITNDEGTTVEMKKIMKYDTVANNLFLVAQDGTFLDKNQIRMIVIDKDLGEIEVDPDVSVFIVLKSSKVKLIPVNGYRGRIMLCCNDITYQYRCRESGLDFQLDREDEVTLNPYKYVGKAKQDISHRLRIYNPDGRLITKRSYNVYKYNNFYDVPRFNIPIAPNKGDRMFLVSYIGYDERLVYHKDDIPNDGLIMLEGKITRPISLVYHDIYLDGYRLTKYDVDIIAPFSFAIKNLAKFDTLSNLEIYEKSFVPDEFVKFDWLDKSEYLLDRLFQKDTEFYESIKSKLDSITPTGTTEDMDKICDWFYDFLREYGAIEFINADHRKDLEAYHHIFDEDGRVLLNGDDRARYSGTIASDYYLSHDKTIEVYGDHHPKNTKVYDEVIIQPDLSICMDESEYRQHGYLTDSDKYMHVYDTDPKFVPDAPYVPTKDPDGTVDHDGTRPAFDPGNLKSKDKDVERYEIDPLYEDTLV